nr:hypothetical protein [Patescibacteria group bacterium]
MFPEAEDNIRITSHGAGGINLEGFSQDSQEKAEAALRAGANWIRVVQGKLKAIPVYQELPDPMTDEELLPFWRKRSDTGNMPDSLFDTLTELNEVPEHSSASLSVQSLCGYFYTDERYKQEAAKLCSYGFECLRSRRDKDARFWEIWYLPGLW